jgi:hypothetical protein
MSEYRITLGQVAYEAYVEATRGVSLVSGVLLPRWDQQAEGIRAAWEHAADAVVLWHGGA